MKQESVTSPGTHYKIAVWEVLNEIDFEHNWTPEAYVQFYDAVVSAMRAVEPKLQFHGAGAGERRQSEDVRILSRSGAPSAGNSAGLHQLSLLCNASRRRGHAHMAIYLLGPGRYVSAHGAICGCDTEAPLAGDQAFYNALQAKSLLQVANQTISQRWRAQRLPLAAGSFACCARSCSFDEATKLVVRPKSVMSCERLTPRPNA
jgi:hypothetical protein